jgi:hypothetical protein
VARPADDVTRRLRLGLVAAAALLVLATAWRTSRLSHALPPAQAQVRSLDVESLDGGLLLLPDSEGWSVRSLRSGRTVALGEDRQARVGRVQVAVDGGDGVRRTPILRTPWSVFADGQRGFRRIDFGADPLGRDDGVHDRVVLPAADDGARGWFHLAPRDEHGEPGGRFAPEDAGQALLVAERDGLHIERDDGTDARPEAGEAVPVGARFVVGDGGPVRVEVRWQRVARAQAVLGGDGKVIGYRDGVGIDLVVTALEPGAAASDRADVQLLDRRGTELATVVVSASRPTLLHGRRDRLSPLRGRVLPQSTADEELEQAVAEGLSEGWIDVGLSRAEVHIPTEPDGDGPREDLGWALSRSVVALVDTYDRARAPVALRLGDEVRASAASATVDGDRQPLRWDRELGAWAPSSRTRPGAELVFELPVTGGDGVVPVEAAFPMSWRTGDDQRWRTAPPPPSGAWRTTQLPAAAGSLLQVKLETRVDEPAEGDARVAVSIGGAPDGTFLDAEAVRMGRRAFEGWRLRGSSRDGLARRLWARLPGDRWSVDAAAPEAGRRRAERLYLRAPIDARRAGWTALDLSLPGAVLAATWNDEPLDAAALPRAGGGSARISVPTRPGRNLLALEMELPPTAPASQAGGIRFVVDEQGAPSALDGRVADRRARTPVRSAAGAQQPTGRGERDAPAVLVEVGVPGLPEGSRWQVTPSADRAGHSGLLLADAPGPIARNAHGVLELTDEALLWRNGPLRLAVVRRVETDPDGPPLAGFAVAPSAPQPLQDDGDAIVAPDFALRRLPSGGERLTGERIVVHAGRVHALAEEGAPAWSAPATDADQDEEHEATAADAEVAGLRLDLFSPDGAQLLLRANRPGRLWSVDGRSTELAAEVTTPWPRGARLLLEGTPLRLRRPLAAEESPLDARPSWLAAVSRDAELTLDDDLQAAAERALDAELARLPEADGDTMSLRGAVLVWDPREGDVLACAARQRDDADPRTLLTFPCWQDGGLHPGSTFKIATAGAALRSSDPAVRAMLQGSLPAGLRAGGPPTTLRKAKLPALPDRAGDELSLRSRMRNHAGHSMPVDATLEDALRSSYNLWFGYVGLLMHRPLREGWGRAGIARAADRLEAWPVAAVARRAGFDARLELGAGVVGTSGHVPEDAVDNDARIAARSIGQDEVTATPLGVAALVGTVVDGGTIARPRLVRDRPIERVEVLPPAVADRLATALGEVVMKGTASRALGDNPWRERMLGKTGSAQRIDGEGLERTDAWFAAALRPPEGSGEAPVVIVCVLPGGGLGGRHAAEVVDAVSRDVLRARGWID